MGGHVVINGFTFLLSVSLLAILAGTRAASTFEIDSRSKVGFLLARCGETINLKALHATGNACDTRIYYSFTTRSCQYRVVTSSVTHEL